MLETKDKKERERVIERNRGENEGFANKKRGEKKK